MEIGTEENAKLVSRVYEKAMDAVHADKSITDAENFVYQIELLSQEVNSGASFEQYFRWASTFEITEILKHVEDLKLPEVYETVQEAINTAFPNGIPKDNDEKEECTEWSEDQEIKLERLFEKFENYNCVIINKLGEFIKDNKLD